MRALFLTKYGLQGGSSRYMVHDYVEFYEQAGIACTVFPLFDDRYFNFQVLDKPTGLSEIMRHAGYYLSRVASRLGHLFSARRYDVVVFEKELVPYVPYGLEAILKLLQPKTVMLLDDATYIYYARHPSALVRLACRNKIERVMQACAHIIVWNEHLGEYARRFNPSVSVVNTGIDLRRYRVKETARDGMPDTSRAVIGWIGTPNSFPYVRTLESVFQTLARHYNVELHVISSQPYTSPHINVVNKTWSLQTEIEDLLALDIGIMPLPDDEWTRGKSGAKAVQYMATGVPTVCSAVGVAPHLIQDGINGLLASNAHEWESKLTFLIENPTLRREMGLRGRRTVEDTYCLQAVAPRLIRILYEAGQHSLQGQA